MSEETVLKALDILLEHSNYPICVLCGQGSHRTGTVVGCLRKLQRWNLTSIFEEYRRYAGAKVRLLNEQFIELFDTDLVQKQYSTQLPWLQHHTGGTESKQHKNDRDQEVVRKAQPKSPLPTTLSDGGTDADVQNGAKGLSALTVRPDAVHEGLAPAAAAAAAAAAASAAAAAASAAGEAAKSGNCQCFHTIRTSPTTAHAHKSKARVAFPYALLQIQRC